MNLMIDECQFLKAQNFENNENIDSVICLADRTNDTKKTNMTQFLKMISRICSQDKLD